MSSSASSASTAPAFAESPSSPPQEGQDVVMERQEVPEQVVTDEATKKARTTVTATATVEVATNGALVDVDEGTEQTQNDSGFESEEEEEDGRTSRNNYYYHSPTVNFYQPPPSPPPGGYHRCLRVCQRHGQGHGIET